MDHRLNEDVKEELGVNTFSMDAMIQRYQEMARKLVKNA
jgi:hypothetical protein